MLKQESFKFDNFFLEANLLNYFYRSFLLNLLLFLHFNSEIKQPTKNSKEVSSTNQAQLDINSVSLHLHDRPNSGTNTNTTARPPRASTSVPPPQTTSSSSLALAQAAALADAQKRLALAVQASQPAQPTVKPQVETTGKRLLSATKIINLDLTNLDASSTSQPVIYDMFEDYPQPLATSVMIIDLTMIEKPILFQIEVFIIRTFPEIDLIWTTC
jgi:hypothetical protein